MTKQEWLDMWKLSGEEGEKIWQLKMRMDEKSFDAPMVTDDIKPYVSQINGEVITSRSQHRNHLREHNCIEIGNETHHLKSKPVEPPKGLKQELIKAVYQHGRK